jgi:hypothetical protein
MRQVDFSYRCVVGEPAKKSLVCLGIDSVALAAEDARDFDPLQMAIRARCKQNV